MKKLRLKIRTIQDFNRFSKLLAERLKTNKPISDNAMLDGMIIGFILTSSFAKDLFLDNEIGCVMDGTRQKLEQIIIWVENNEDELCSIL